MPTIAIYGGTFDPVHPGHIATALAIENFFHFDQLNFLPCKDPILKPKAIASAKHRVAMLKIALKNFAHFNVDTREIDRDTPSRMVETLESYREEYPTDPLTLVMGMDAFASLPKWYAWEKIIQLANILVLYRPGFHLEELPTSVIQLLDDHQTGDKEDLLTCPQGKILQIDAGHFDFASSQIRKNFAEKLSVEEMLDPVVYEYILENKLYLLTN